MTFLWNFATYSYWQCQKTKRRNGCGRMVELLGTRPDYPPTCPCGVNGKRNPNIMTRLWKQPT